MAGIERLHPHLQHAIVNDLGWRSLRPVQDLTIDAVLDGANCVVLAPPAGVKTEASDAKVSADYVRNHIKVGIESLKLIRRHGKSVRHLRFDE